MNTINKNVFLAIAAISFILMGIIPSESIFITLLFMIFFASLVMYFYPKVIALFNKKSSKVDTQVINQSEVLYETKVNDFVETSKHQSNKPRDKRISVYVAGISYRQSNLKKIVRSFVEFESYDKFENMTNSEIIDYGDTVYEYPVLECSNVTLEHEPTNEYDPNAIKVMVELGENEHCHIGYVPSEEIDLVIEYLEKGFSYELAIKGGKYKEVEYDLEKDKDIVVTKNSDYFAILYFLPN